MNYLRGPGSARSQVVPCVKTFSFLSALCRPGEMNGGRGGGGLWDLFHSLVVSHTRLAFEEKEKNSYTFHTILIVVVREGSTTDH